MESVHFISIPKTDDRTRMLPPHYQFDQGISGTQNNSFVIDDVDSSWPFALGSCLSSNIFNMDLKFIMKR